MSCECSSARKLLHTLVVYAFVTGIVYQTLWMSAETDRLT